MHPLVSEPRVPVRFDAGRVVSLDSNGTTAYGLVLSGSSRAFASLAATWVGGLCDVQPFFPRCGSAPTPVGVGETRKGNLMHRRSLLLALVLLAAVAVPVALSSPLQSFHLGKTCDNLGTCTVTSSTLGVLPPGTTETYLGPEYGYPVLSSRVVITTPDGTAVGHCTWPFRVL